LTLQSTTTSSDPTRPMIFENNVATIGGGVIHAVIDSIVITKGSFVARNNKAHLSGGFVTAFNSNLYLEQCHCINNTAPYGAVMSMEHANLTLIGHDSPTIPTIIEENVATTLGIILALNNSNITTTSIGSFVFRNNSVEVCSLDLIGILEENLVKDVLTLDRFMKFGRLQEPGVIYMSECSISCNMILHSVLIGNNFVGRVSTMNELPIISIFVIPVVPWFLILESSCHVLFWFVLYFDFYCLLIHCFMLKYFPPHVECWLCDCNIGKRCTN
jgi:hypothetical protein